ncbi:MAG TPA: glycoside hydrolase family 13 protein [Clostridia bacterium]|nr:glycoside hydrolase family 13 protein [Clostridia bacterium]
MDQNWIFHDSHQSKYRKPFGAVACGKKIILSLSVKSQHKPDGVILRLWKNNREEERIEMNLVSQTGQDFFYQIDFTAPSNPGLLWYYFIVYKEGKTYYYGNNEAKLGGIGAIYEYEPPSYQITVHKKEAVTPNWFKEAVMYQIFVDRFFNGCEDGKILARKDNCHIYTNWYEDVPVYRRDPESGRIVSYDFFGGNLLGVIKKLPYLKDLGINVIYLNPVFESASNHKYDTGDYKKIDPMFGDNSTFELLCAKAQELGIYIILDGVFSHTGSDSIYFNKEGNYPGLGAYQSKDSPYYSWYRFYHYPDQYECWWGIDTLPNVNEMEPSYQDFIIYGEDSVLKYWMRLGAKGWRLDVADELPDEFIKVFWKTMKEVDPDSILIGEVWEDASNKISYGKLREYLWGEELDSVMNYPFRNIFLDYLLNRKNARETHLRLMQLYENYPRHYFYSLMNLIGSHDVPRVLTLLGDAPPEESLSKEEQARYRLSPEQKELALARLKLFTLIQMTFPGVPCIYYGDEAGMEGYKDPLNRGTYPWGRENRELLNWYKKVIALRNSYPVFKTGEWISFYVQEDVYGYIRRIGKGRDIFGQERQTSTAILLFNRNHLKKIEFELDLSKWCAGVFVDLLNGKREIDLGDGIINLSLLPLEGKVLLQR